MDEVKIRVPSSTANVGLGYDVWCLGIERPYLDVTFTRIPEGIEIETKSPYQPPRGRTLGYAGKSALENFFREFGINEGAHLLFEDNGYPTGGLGRSGAEAVGAITAAAVIYDRKLSRDETIALSAKGEPGEHKDNVAASTNGRLNIVVPSVPYTGKPSVDFYDVPEDLGLAIGFSSYQKTGGTEAGREALRNPVDVGDFVEQMGLVSAATAAIVTGNTDRFLELAWGDRFHQPRRARIHFYGNFDDKDFLSLQRTLFFEFHIAMNVSGAGPNMQFLYNKDEHRGPIACTASSIVAPWFKERGIDMEISDMEIAIEGAYDYAQKGYGW